MTSAERLEDSIALLNALPELSELWIKDTSISESMVIAIVATRSLEAIELSGTDLDDAGVERFIGMPHLRELNFRRTQVPPFAVKRFKGLHPRLRQSWSF